jgi:DNA adenine methylase
MIEILSPMRPDKELFYKIRENRSEIRHKNAAELIYLNRVCWNGLYRVNSKGKFNVPYGAPRSDFIFDKDNLRACSELLNKRGVTIRRADFLESVSRAREGDLVFFDPPYVTKHNFNGFRDWNEKLFSWSDQERLAKAAHRLAERGVKVLVANAEHDDVAALYSRFGKIVLKRNSTLASNALKRGPSTEALFYACN